MSSSFEKAVKGGTKVKLAPPKSKYVEHILQATNSEAGVAEVFRTLTHRLRDSTWTVAFKSLIIVHLMIKEGAGDATLSYLSGAPRNRLAINHFTDVQTQGQNIRRYSEYLLVRAEGYAQRRTDFVRSGAGHMKRLAVDKGLLKETELVQEQIKALIKCDLLSTDVENEISLMAFRLLTRDLLDLYNVENEAVMNVLSHYFEMSKTDAERAIRIYKKFCTQTTEVVQYLSVARQYEHATRLEIPKIKHAPTSLAKSLQEYLDDKDFEINRRQYLAEQEAKRTGKPVQKLSQSKPEASKSTAPAAAAAASSTDYKGPDFSTPSQQPKGPAPDLIDFFESIEQNQQTTAPGAPQYQQQQQYTTFPEQQQQPFVFPQQTGYQQDPQAVNGFGANGTNPFGQPIQQQQQPQPQQQYQPMQSQYTGAGFGGYGPQPQQQFATGDTFGQNQPTYGSPTQMQSSAPFQAPQQTGSNPFRQNSMPTGGAPLTSNPAEQQQSTNPFARSTGTSPMPGNAFAQQAAQQQAAFSPQRTAQQQSPFSPQQAQQPQPMQPQPTGTNPLARNLTSQQQPAPMPNALQVQSTGSTNPFRQSAFVNQQTGQGWQNTPQASMGGWENLETIPVFPRPGQTTSR